MTVKLWIGGLAVLLGTVIAPTAVTSATQAGCDQNYTGACVPIADDVDCEGGSGDGPAFVAGPVTVVGEDVYDLDDDGDGIGCEGDGGTTPTTTSTTTTTVPPSAPPPAEPVVQEPDFTG